ncbi:hypothetical protein GOL82_26205 [Sinorhizobium medicae]|nr:hypothetical protein [Sinorhizobium medicae]MDX0421099.1 hypothetical protein [Sinorhizobium medicae]MDX1034695.1 hypothetical protein [Sinorhizobium medicae]
MQFRIAMEIVRIDGRLPVDLIMNGYRFSKYGSVAFILHEVTPQTVNRILDPIVPTMGLDIPGVRYIDIKSEADVFEAIFSASTIIAFSPEFCSMVTGLDLPYIKA